MNGAPFQTCHGPAIVIRETYAEGGLAVLLVAPDGEPLTRLSTRLDDSAALPEGHFYAKTWSENEGIAADALANGPFEVATEYPPRPAGSCSAPVWRFKNA